MPTLLLSNGHPEGETGGAWRYHSLQYGVGVLRTSREFRPQEGCVMPFQLPFEVNFVEKQNGCMCEYSSYVTLYSNTVDGVSRYCIFNLGK